MTVLTCAITGKSITLLSEIVNSGEAKVWRTNQNGYLAKIYHSPTPERVQKLAVMIANPPTEPNSHLNHISFAWPKSALKNAQGDCVGFLMPEIKDGKELIDVYNPRRRQALKLEIDWRFLHTTALNIVSIIEALHAAGYVLGDIKPQNILVNNRALPSIIDTDSFQVINPKNGKVYYCLVGSEGYTPPELIGKDFDRIEQTEVHDRFRLGVIIYQLLFGGNNPFQGKWTGAGETPDINELICQGLWVNGSTNLIAAVARTIPLEIVHPEVQQCFLKCFNDGHKNPNFRPTARKWLEALKVGNDRLTICGRVDNHYYSRTYGKCYWCDRSTNLGVDIFPGVVKAKPSASVESTSQTNIFAATNILELVKQKGKIITVVGKVFITRHLIKQNIVFINFGDVSNLVNGYSSFTIVILSEGLKNLSNYRSLTVNQLSNCAGSYIKITGTLELYQKIGRITPQIILKDPNQISLISETEANQLIVGHTNTTNSSSVKQNQSQVSQTPVYKPQSQSVITQPTAISSTTNNSSSVQQPQSQVSQVTQSTNLPNSSRRRFLRTVALGSIVGGVIVAVGSITKHSNKQANYFEEDLGNSVKLQMVQIPGGKFLMGSPESEEGRESDESPQHEVTVPGFFMGRYEVTQAQYQAIMGSNPSSFKGDSFWFNTNQRPVETVSWDDAVKFCQVLSQKTGKNYRLPSEAEWEYACRAGTTTPFYFGDNIRSITTDLVNCRGVDGYRGETTDVGNFPPNAFGLYDMHGNVREWCEDDQYGNYTNTPIDGSAWTSQNGNRKVLRGGSWLNKLEYCRSAYRGNGYFEEDGYLFNIGFRVVCAGAARN